MALNNCMTCDVSVYKNYLVCSECKKIIHYKCAGVTKTLGDAIIKSDNIFWFCASCKDIYNASTNKISELTELIKNIDVSVKNIEVMAQTKCQNISQPPIINSGNCSSVTLDALPIIDDLSNCMVPSTRITAEHVLDSVTTSTDSLSSSTSTCRSTFAEVLSSSTTAVKLKNSVQPSKRTKPICGTRVLPTDYGVKKATPLLWLHLSRFDPSITEDKISSMAKTCLNIDSCNVIKLIPKNRCIQSLEYVCYKLGIQEKWRAKALDSNSWPAGVFIREFENSNFRSTLPPREKFRTPTTVNNK